VFDSEKDFEEALIKMLFNKGWEDTVLRYPTELDLIENWAKILFDNNKDINRLNNQPLTTSEMSQIIEQINLLKTPLKLNSFINGKTVSIRRDNELDTLHFGKEISLKIYDRMEIAKGSSRYQIAQQPQFPTKSPILNDRRGDLMLLINGMPVFHIELKKSGIPVSQATNQIEKYSREGIFTGLFSLVQIFVAMEPAETVYFANPGPDGKFNSDYFFHWADFDNEPINDWKGIASNLISIPMAHQLIGFYTVPDDTDGVLKVMRSYQYFATHTITDRVARIKWGEDNQLGGYIWHTTGSGKTLTSFKSAQLIANSRDADKVVFLMDRIELGTQSLHEYRGFADDSESVQATENTDILITKLKSDDPADTLIVTSIQKMSNIYDVGAISNRPPSVGAISTSPDKTGHTEMSPTIDIINRKRIVIIVDEAHRSTFGEMLSTIKETFPFAIFFGFTGTPIHIENEKKGNTTSDVFGNELHRYSIADGIRDQNVLGFDPYMVATFKDRDVRKAVALHQAKAESEEEVFSDEKKNEVFTRFMNPAIVKMAGYENETGDYTKGIEDYVPGSQYNDDIHREQVVKDIIETWFTLSKGGKFHSLFATHSIPEAIKYYRFLKFKCPTLKVTAQFDQNIDNLDNTEYKSDGIVEIMTDYNNRYGQSYSLSNYDRFKKDIASRLAHKKPYVYIEREPEKQIDLLIVVDQMLTGYDSKWINALYIDKVMQYEKIIQAFSRTNRLFGPDKPFGTIRYYRKPHTMRRNIDEAVKLYSGDKPLGLFVNKLADNLQTMNLIFEQIRDIFESAGISDFGKLPEEKPSRKKFASLFKKLNEYLEAAKIQNFKWEKTTYTFEDESGINVIEMSFDEQTYLILALRYKEMFDGAGGGAGCIDVPYELVEHLTEIDTGMINTEYLNNNFDKYMKMCRTTESNDEDKQKALDELHKSFASLTAEEQKYASILLRDIQRGDVEIKEGKTFRDYITVYQSNANSDQIHDIAVIFGLNENMLRELMRASVNAKNLNELGRFDKLRETVDYQKAREYFLRSESEDLSGIKLNIRVNNMLEMFILSGGFDVNEEGK
jgi:type I restriction enzyme R subunit